MIQTFEQFINESQFSTHYGKNAKNWHLYNALKKALSFCDENNLVYQTIGGYCKGLKFDKINIFKDGTKGIGLVDKGGIPECIAMIYGDNDGNVIYILNGEQRKSLSELLNGVLENK